MEVGQALASGHFIAFRGGADGPAGLLLALNPAQVTCITSAWDKGLNQNVLIIHLVNNRVIKVFESGVEDVLRELGLGEHVGDWVFDLEKDLG
jgi:hypothetical protein